MQRSERLWQQALQVSEAALATGALVPLDTHLEQLQGLEPFVLRRLLSRSPRHLRPEGPRPNPFLPWDVPLEVERLGQHVILLNKFPVQPAHLLVITAAWAPQRGWLTPADWQAVARVAADTGGLWFFNSSAVAGASQPHRHLQLLPRRREDISCPLAPLLEQQLQGAAPPWPWAYHLSRRRDPLGGNDLPELYREHCRALGLGEVGRESQPQAAYNLLFDDHWFLSVRRRQEHCAGLSINALGFAGYLLSTSEAQEAWLMQHGPWRLLEAVADPRDACGLHGPAPSVTP